MGDHTLLTARDIHGPYMQLLTNLQGVNGREWLGALKLFIKKQNPWKGKSAPVINPAELILRNQSFVTVTDSLIIDMDWSLCYESPKGLRVAFAVTNGRVTEEELSIPVRAKVNKGDVVVTTAQLTCELERALKGDSEVFAKGKDGTYLMYVRVNSGQAVPICVDWTSNANRQSIFIDFARFADAASRNSMLGSSLLVEFVHSC